MERPDRWPSRSHRRVQAQGSPELQHHLVFNGHLAASDFSRAMNPVRSHFAVSWCYLFVPIFLTPCFSSSGRWRSWGGFARTFPAKLPSATTRTGECLPLCPSYLTSVVKNLTGGRRRDRGVDDLRERAVAVVRVEQAGPRPRRDTQILPSAWRTGPSAEGTTCLAQPPDKGPPQLLHVTDRENQRRSTAR